MLKRTTRDAVLEPDQQYAVVLLNEEQLGQFMRRPGIKQINRGYSVPDVHSRYLRLKRQTATAAVVLLVLAAGGFMYAMKPQPALASMYPWREARDAPTLETGASFSVTIASLESGDGAGAAAGRVRALGLPSFTRVSPDRRKLNQAMVGPYASLDEAERVQRRLARSGFSGARIFVDESLRNAPRNGLRGEAVEGNPAVVLVGGPDRVSLVFELPLEPRQVRSRRSESMLDIDVGPMSNPIRPQQWSAPEGVHLVERVGIEGIAASETGQFLRAHVAIPEFAHANVRNEGRRVYVDLTWPQAPPEVVAQRLAAGLPTAAVAQAPRPAQPTVVSQDDRGDDNYEDAVRPAQERLASMKSFIMSAAQSGSPDVLGALDDTLATLETSIKALHPPAASRDQHVMLIEAIRVARKAMSPGFTGDRVAQAREAFVLYEGASTTAVSITPLGQ